MKDGNINYVFMDESGRKESDRFFVCGFLQIDNNQEFSLALQRVADQIKNLSIRNRQSRADVLLKNKDLGELHRLARTYNEFELKHYHITNENRLLYSDLIKVLFRKTKFKFHAIVIDRQHPSYVRDQTGQFPLYLKTFKMFTTCCIKVPNYIFVPDSFEPGFNWKVKSGILPVSILPLDSKACVQLQICDVLSGLIGQALKINAGVSPNNKDLVRESVVKTLETELGKKITGNMTVQIPNYFSVWVIDWNKSKGRGMDKKPNPSLMQV